MMLIVHARLNEALGRDAAAGGTLPPTWFDVLIVLDSTPGHRARLRDLAEAVLLTRAGLSRLLDRIEAAGLLRREACEGDARGTYAALTDAGSAALRETWPAHFRAIDERLADALGPDAATVAAALKRVAAANDWLPDLRPVQLTVPPRRRAKGGKSTSGRG